MYKKDYKYKGVQLRIIEKKNFWFKVIYIYKSEEKS